MTLLLLFKPATQAQAAVVVLGGGANKAYSQQALQQYLKDIRLQQNLLKLHKTQVKTKKTVTTDIEGSILATIPSLVSGLVKGWNITPISEKLRINEFTKTKSKISALEPYNFSGKIERSDIVSWADSEFITKNRTERQRKLDKLKKILAIYKQGDNN